MLAAVVGSALLVSWIISSIYRNNNSGLKDIPNAHFSVPYSRLCLLSTRSRKIENRSRLHLHRRLGPIVRLGPRDVSVNCIDDGVRTIYGANFDIETSFYYASFDK